MDVRKIVVVVEDVEIARTALQWTLQNLLRYGDIITLLHIFSITRSKSKKKLRLLRLQGFQLALSFQDICNNFFNVCYYFNFYFSLSLYISLICMLLMEYMIEGLCYRRRQRLWWHKGIKMVERLVLWLEKLGLLLLLLDFMNRVFFTGDFHTPSFLFSYK